jgi:serine/threonine protein kinase
VNTPKAIPFGSYFLLERLAIGGMAEVYLAKATVTPGPNELVALKRILPNIAEDDEFIAMFIDEAKIAGQLNHPNIAQIYDLGRIHGSYFIAMEYVSGHDLRALWERAREDGDGNGGGVGMPLAFACYAVKRLCEGLDYAHRRRDARGRPLGIIHRDVSPQNILLSYAGDVKVIDFGIAKAANRMVKTQTGILKGKFAYMAPEQARGEPIDHRVDVFAIGVMLYELLTGHRAFAADSDFALLEKVRKAQVKPVREYRPEIPRELAEIAHKALARDPNERYPWASNLAMDLDRFMRSERLTYNKTELGAYVRRLFSEEHTEEESRLEAYALVDASGDTIPNEPIGYKERSEKRAAQVAANDETVVAPSERSLPTMGSLGVAHADTEMPTEESNPHALGRDAEGKLKEDAPPTGQGVFASLQSAHAAPADSDEGGLSDDEMDTFVNQARPDLAAKAMAEAAKGKAKPAPKEGTRADVETRSLAHLDSGPNALGVPTDSGPVGHLAPREKTRADQNRSGLALGHDLPSGMRPSETLPVRRRGGGNTAWIVGGALGILLGIGLTIGFLLLQKGPPATFVVAKPRPARVMEGNKELCPATPCLLRLEEGPHALVFSALGFVPHPERVVVGDADKVVEVEMEPATVDVDLETIPAGARVELNGKKLKGKTPLKAKTMQVGSTAHLRFWRDGYAPLERDWVISPENLKFSVELPRSTTRFVVSPTPEDALITVDEKPTWHGEYTLKLDYQKEAKIKVERPGCDPYEEVLSAQGKAKEQREIALICRPMNSSLSLKFKRRYRVVIDDVVLPSAGEIESYRLPAGSYQVEARRGRKVVAKTTVTVAPNEDKVVELGL